jgi:hypothetical protein
MFFSFQQQQENNKKRRRQKTKNRQQGKARPYIAIAFPTTDG